VELVKFLKYYEIVPVAYCPVGKAGGFVAAEGKKQIPDINKDPIITSICQKYGKTPTQVVLKWGLQRGHAVIPKATSVEHQRENFDLHSFELTEEEVNEITN
jgi:diketogulonate reductase-like aldo/keto reductase